jgi:hypothetical protein
VVQGVPGIVRVGVLVCVEPAVGVFMTETTPVDCPPMLNVDIEAITWWVECMYGE